MNYIVTSIYKVCRHEELTMLIVYRMLTSDELGLKQVYEDQGETIQALCF